MADQIEKIKNSLVQHGKENNRLYLMKLDSSDDPSLILESIEKIVVDNNYSKIFIKVPLSKEKLFTQFDYRTEATIPGFYKGQEAAVLMARYPDKNRAQITRDVEEQINKVLAAARAKEGSAASPLDPDFELSEAIADDANQIANVYKEVFASYPFPIFDPQYIKETMKSHIKYFVVKDRQKIIAVSSAEIDNDNKNAEMTDFATLPEYRGQDLGLHLLIKMDQEMPRTGIMTGYTIARSVSFGMNITFAKAGYQYSGTLINNTNISGDIENMNVWHRELL